jgi:sec-independent protein translocase protein TatA
MDIGPAELIIILFIVVLVFGSGRLVNLGKELGTGIREFRKGLDEKEDPKPSEEETTEKDEK